MAPKKGKKITRKDIMTRSIIVLLVITLGFVANIGTLIKVQIVDGDVFKAYAEKNQLEDKTITAQRGVIYDRNMNVLAQSASVWKVYVNPSNFKDFPQEVTDTAVSTVSKKLAEILDMDEDTVKNKIVNYYDKKYIAVKAKVEKTQRDEVSEFLREYISYKDSAGNAKRVYYSYFIGVEADTKRYYPGGSLASTVLGFTGSDDQGLYGIERTYNNELTGTDGRLIYSNSAMNQNSSVDFESVYDAQQGSSLVLTLDETIQRYLEDALGQCYEDSKCATCYGIVMDVKTGAILAMATKNDFDPNEPSKITDNSILEKLNKIVEAKEKTEETQTARQNQWSNNAIMDLYEPGSVFKVITLSAALEEGEAMDSFYCNGHIQIDDRNYYCHNHSGHGSENLNQGLANSCNPYYITMGQKLGVSRFNKYFEAFGFTEKTGIDLSDETAPVAGVTYHKFDEMTRVNLASCSFGQSFQVNSLQMLTAVNAIANGGKLMKPYLVAKTLDSSGNVIKETEPVVKRQVISESTSQRVLEAMVETVKTGTAKNAYVSGFNVAGKTGTSDNLNPGKEGQYFASFAGVAPANDPEISIIIVVDDPKGATGGGAVAAPVAAEVIENALTYLNVKRNYSDSEKSELNVAVPNFVGNELDAARKQASQKGFTLKIVGEGSKVVSQCPAYGQYIPQNGVVILYTEENSEKVKAKVPDFNDMTVSQAISAATAAGINVKVSGNSLQGAGLRAYRQSVEKGAEVEYGSTVTVYFKTGTGIVDG